jgi:hypothetical protein
MRCKLNCKKEYRKSVYNGLHLSVLFNDKRITNGERIIITDVKNTEGSDI